MKFNHRVNALSDWFRARAIPRITAPYWVAHQVRNTATTYLPAWRSTVVRKPPHQVVVDLVAATWRWRCLPFHYLRYELYTPGHSRDEVLAYIPDTVFYARILPKVNRGVVLLDDKITCKRILASAGLAQPALLLTGEGMTCRTPQGARVAVTSAPDLAKVLQGHAKVVIKPARNSAGGDGIHVLTPIDGVLHHPDGSRFDLRSYTAAWGGWLLEEHLRQREDLAAVNPHSVNTLRVITRYTRPLYCLLKSSTGTSPVDNACHGGLYVRVDCDTGQLDPVARTTGMARLREHPVTGWSFAGQKITGIHAALALAQQAAALFPQTPVIGWDIAFSADAGPVVLEGNSSPSLLNIQRTHGGLADTLGRTLTPYTK